jgi:hypothetical protein
MMVRKGRKGTRGSYRMENWKGSESNMGEMRGGRKKLVCTPFLTGHTVVAV